MLKSRAIKRTAVGKATSEKRSKVTDSFVLGLSTLITVSGGSAFSYQSHLRHRSVNVTLGSDFARIGNDMRRAISKEQEIEKTTR